MSACTARFTSVVKLFTFTVMPLSLVLMLISCSLSLTAPACAGLAGRGRARAARGAAPLPERSSLCFQRLEPPDTVFHSVTQEDAHAIYKRV